jgi:hypothetical protein
MKRATLGELWQDCSGTLAAEESLAEATPFTSRRAAHIGLRRAACIVLILLACSEARVPLPAVQPDLQVRLSRHVLEHGVKPADYVIGCFEKRDVVFLGEYGRILHDVLLVQEVLPRLPAAGVARVGVELVSGRDQDDLDRLVTAETWDEPLARGLVQRHDPAWGYREYLDVLRAAWSVNQGAGAPVLRVVALGGPPHEAMAGLLRAGGLDPGQKTLVYASVETAFTRFRPSRASGLGNLVFDEIGERACTVLLHAPWPSVLGPEAPSVYAADGHIDASLIGLSDENRRAGFDVTGSAFAELRGSTSLWSLVRKDVTLGDLADGYVFQSALHSYQGVTPIAGWYDDEAENKALAESCDIARKFSRYH